MGVVIKVPGRPASRRVDSDPVCEARLAKLRIIIAEEFADFKPEVISRREPHDDPRVQVATTVREAGKPIPRVPNEPWDTGR